MIQPNLSGIEQLALEILNRHRLHQIPVDPVALANKLGITVHNTIFSDESLSVVMTRHSHTSAIFVAHHDTATRKKHSIAHMLGHYLLHMQESATTVDHYQDLLDCPTSLQEPAPEEKTPRVSSKRLRRSAAHARRKLPAGMGQDPPYQDHGRNLQRTQQPGNKQGTETQPGKGPGRHSPLEPPPVKTTPPENSRSPSNR